MGCIKCHSHETVASLSSICWDVYEIQTTIKIDSVPSLTCNNCQFVHINHSVKNEIEDRFMLVDSSKVPNSITYNQLMNQDSLLKNNLF
ncbi:YokU family protein [Evansella cellulosilytica]|uniref:Uncharacterized protein n=1 Tax=Evansella cellulosilytica (strain ATCC 21833 / DSM 2522 / FERM P-1141 / JCM 9156 / N-4) TaxID=649639 RepID=E6U094_EVAC2|nr:YokU family protein [Evansella cellulosilytica]ADU30210.1 hypothetical protein Bcell_1948 [Evansella cellulosilytica DSM 2522]